MEAITHFKLISVSRALFFKSAYRHAVPQDIRLAKLFVILNFQKVENKVKVMAALQGGVILSSSVLNGTGGIKLGFHPGLSIDAAVFATSEFKREQLGLTMMVREACRLGWQPVAAEALKGRGRKPSLLLKGAGEAIPGFNRTRVKCFTARDFIRWLVDSCLNRQASARIHKS